MAFFQSHFQASIACIIKLIASLINWKTDWLIAPLQLSQKNIWLTYDKAIAINKVSLQCHLQPQNVQPTLLNLQISLTFMNE